MTAPTAPHGPIDRLVTAVIVGAVALVAWLVQRDPHRGD